MDQDFVDMCYNRTNPIWGSVWYCQRAQQGSNNWNNYNWEDIRQYGQEMFENCEEAKQKSNTLSNLSPIYQQMKEYWDYWIYYCGIAGYNYNRCAYDYQHGNYEQAQWELNTANSNIVLGHNQLSQFIALFTQNVPGANANPPANIPPGFNPITPPNFNPTP